MRALVKILCKSWKDHDLVWLFAEHFIVPNTTQTVRLLSVTSPPVPGSLAGKLSFAILRQPGIEGPGRVLTLSYRSDADEFDPACVCGSGRSFGGNACSSNDNKLSGWDEWWLDIHSASCISKVESIMSARISSFVAKGCDGVDPDNVDSVSSAEACPNPPYHKQDNSH